MAEHVTEWLGAYHDGELGAAAARKIEAHLAECGACRAELEEIRRLSDLLKDEILEENFILADRFAANVMPIIESIRSCGIVDLRGIAEALNQRGVRTARGGSWHVSNVRNVMRRTLSTKRASEAL